MWEKYFTNAQLYFIDYLKELIDTYCLTASERSQCFLVDQANETSLKDFLQITEGNFDIIIDDGGHRMDQQITSFKMLFPALKSGGIYVIEDLATSFLKEWGGYGTKESPKNGPGTTVTFLQQLVDDLNSFTVKPCGLPFFCADYKRYTDKDMNYYQKNIESIHCYNCIVFIFKR